MSVFPKNFLWGAAASAFQIEGDISNDFTDWGKSGHFKNNGKNPLYTNGSDHWKQWQSDFELLKDQPINSYRLSIEWSRLEPKPGRFNLDALRQYEQMIDCLLKMNIKPMLTLLHFSHQNWFHKKSPWHTPESVGRYNSFLSLWVKKLIYTLH